jgi:recombinational DNA repair protein (RecF pathway)
MSKNEFLNVSEFAKQANLSVSEVKRLLQQGTLRYVQRASKEIAINVAELDRLIEEGVIPNPQRDVADTSKVDASGVLRTPGLYAIRLPHGAMVLVQAPNAAAAIARVDAHPDSPVRQVDNLALYASLTDDGYLRLEQLSELEQLIEGTFEDLYSALMAGNACETDEEAKALAEDAVERERKRF